MKNFWRIDMRLLPVKVHFFIFMAALACVIPFRTVFAKQLGISATAVGVIFLAVPFLKIVTNPLFGFIMDYFKKFRLTMAVILIVVALSHVAMILIPPKHNEGKENFNMKKMLDFDVNYSCLKQYLPGNQNQFDLHMYQKPDSPQVHHVVGQQHMCKLQCKNYGNLKSDILEAEEDFRHVCTEQISLELSVLINILAYSSKINTSFVNRSFIFIPEYIHNITMAVINHTPLLLTIDLPTPISKSKQIEEMDISTISELLRQNETKFQSNASHIFKTQTSTTYSLMSCPCQAKFKCITVHCHFVRDNSEVFPNELQQDSNEFLSMQFWGLFILISISSVSFSSLLFMMDAVCYEMLVDKKEKYGEQRLWGTVGWGVGALAGSYLNQILSSVSTKIDYAPSFYLLAALTFIDLIPIYKLKAENVQYSSHICKDVGRLLSKTDMIVNILIVFSVGVLSGLIWNYQFWFMEEIGASQVLLGLSQIFECLFAELPCFLISGWIIRKVGHMNCNSITFLCFGLRYLCFAYMYNPWMTLPLAILHGPTFGLFYASMTMQGKTEAPPGTEATVQSLLSMSFEGVGAATGSVLGGVGFDKFGSRATFLYSALVSFALLLLNILWHIIQYKKRRSVIIQEKAAC